MTVGYSDRVATCRGHGNFWKMLFRWKGSIYKVVWFEMIVYLILYYTLNAAYRMWISQDCERKKVFVQIVKYCETAGKVIPLSFILSFYVSIVVDRWWKQWLSLSWPDQVALFVASLISGKDDRARLIRRTIMRYTNLSFVMTTCLISTAAKLRFPSLTHLVSAGFVQDHEKDIIDEMNMATSHPKYWVPIVWAGSICRRARKEGKIRDDITLNTLIESLNSVRKGLQGMLNYDWVNVPLVYTQAVTIAVYLYFIAALVGKQVTIVSDSNSDEPVDLYVPFFSFCEFFFYVGWLKVAECLINPYGMDDDDYEINWLIDRNFEVSYVIVDDMHDEHPNLLKDQYWDEKVPFDLPYTESTVKYRDQQIGSAKHMEVPPEKADFVRHVDEHGRPTSHMKIHHGKRERSNESLKKAFAKMSGGSSTGGRQASGASNGQSHVSTLEVVEADGSDSEINFVRAARPQDKARQKHLSKDSKEIDTIKSYMEKQDVIYNPKKEEHDEK